VLIYFGSFGADFDERHQKPNCLTYTCDADKGESYWLSTDSYPDEWTEQVLSKKPDSNRLSVFLPTLGMPVLIHDAPEAELLSPKIQIHRDQKNNETRTIIARITSKMKAPIISLYFKPELKIVSATINGLEIQELDILNEDDLNTWWRWDYYGVPVDGIVLKIEIELENPLEIKLAELSYGLPDLRGVKVKPRPVNMMPAPYTLSDMTIIVKVIRL
jgi:hypothetical protein